MSNRDKEYYKNKRDVNMIPSRNRYNDNKSNVLEQQKEYYKNHKYYILEHHQRYYKEHKDKIREKCPQNIFCNICKRSVLNNNITRHKTSAKHQRNLEKSTSSEQSDD